MKHTFLLIVFCSVFLSANAQKDVKGDSLASDFRHMVKLLEETHPDPYTSFGGKVFFHKQAFLLENELRKNAATLQTFFDKVSAFLSRLQDGHTYLIMPSSGQQTTQRFLPLEIRTIPEGIILQGVPREYGHLLGSRLTAINGHRTEEVLNRVAAMKASENLYDRYANLSRYIRSEHFLQQLFPEQADSVCLSLLTPDDQTCEMVLPFLPQEEIKKTELTRNSRHPGFPTRQLEYRFVDDRKQVMQICINSIMARDNFEYMYKKGWSDLYRQMEFYYRSVINEEMPADTLQAIRNLKSFSETFGQMLREMKKTKASTLIIDLRNNSGGWTPITLPVLYQLYGDRYLQKDMDMKFYRLISPLYMQKLETDLPSYNRQRGTNYAFGDYTFYNEEKEDTAGIEQQRANFIDYCMSSNPDELRKQQGKPLYAPKHIYVVTNDHTFSAAFHFTFYLWKMGATIVGVPSGQAPNTFMEQTLFRLPYTGLQGSISNSAQYFLTSDDKRAKTLYPDLMPTYEDYRKYKFDTQAEILYLLEERGYKN